MAAQMCARPNCMNVVSDYKVTSWVDLIIRRRKGDELAVNIAGRICAGCSNDLADWWNK